ncbi:MobF family relaxase [Corynebacterium phocae]|uniref:MobF family relaxase n=1 Tax=Corynebacterium phocae TaxID=161895 RepID=UPI000A77D5A7|nr:MobF family relaxase [Corynebacterium phocae]KAA8719787.1 relaxase domain-containing protein [Corynebacterium phocae]
MLTIAKMGAHSVAYYESTVEGEPGADSYYSEAGSSPGRAWVVASTRESFAEVSKRLGVVSGEFLRGGAVQDWFNKVVAPSGERLGRAPGEKSVPGFDLTFCAPKSVSVLWGLSDDEAVRAVIDSAHNKAVSAALGYLHEHAGYTRRQDPTVKEKRLIIEKVPALSGVRYEHRTSRAGDPHIHSHVLLANRQVCQDGKVRTLDSKGIFHEARAAGMIYQATLREILAENLGVEWGQRSNGCAEIAGLDDEELIKRFSTRAQEIDQWQQANGLEVRGGYQRVAQKITRQTKDVAIAIEELYERWLSNPFAKQVQRFARLLGGCKPQLRAGEDKHREQEWPSAEEILGAVVDERSTFTRADVVEKVAELLPVGVVASEKLAEVVEGLATEALAHADAWVVTPEKSRAVDNTEREGALRFTTKSVVSEVSGIVRMASSVTHRGVNASAIVPIEGVLSQEQADAMRTVVQSSYRASVVVAPAGAGKTSSLKAAREVWENAGKTVIGLAPTGKAADVMVGESVAHESMTIARALGRDEKVRPRARARALGWDSSTVVVVDEAGMVASPDMYAIMATVEAAGARVVFVGDPCQYSAVKARSGVLATLARELPDAVELTEVFRQRSEQEREASKWLRSGEQELTERAAQWYARNGRLHAGSVSAMLEDALAGWEKDTGQGKDSLLVAATGQQVHALNTAAQKIRAGRGELDMDAWAGLSDGVDCYVGDMILTRRNDYSLTTNAGDVVRNGQRWIVQDITDTGAVVAASDHNPEVTVTLPAEYLQEHTQLGYASTGHCAQGATVDIARVVAGVGNLDRASVYVPMTRGREGNCLYIAEVQPGDSDTGHGNTTPVKRRESVEYARDILASAASRDRADHTPQTVYGHARMEWELGRFINGSGRDVFAGTEMDKFMQCSEKNRARRFAEYGLKGLPGTRQDEFPRFTHYDLTESRKRSSGVHERYYYVRRDLESIERNIGYAQSEQERVEKKIRELDAKFEQLGKFSQWRKEKEYKRTREHLYGEWEKSTAALTELEKKYQRAKDNAEPLRVEVEGLDAETAVIEEYLNKQRNLPARPLGGETLGFDWDREYRQRNGSTPCPPEGISLAGLVKKHLNDQRIDLGENYRHPQERMSLRERLAQESRQRGNDSQDYDFGDRPVEEMTPQERFDLQMKREQGPDYDMDDRPVEDMTAQELLDLHWRKQSRYPSGESEQQAWVMGNNNDGGLEL